MSAGPKRSHSLWPSNNCKCVWSVSYRNAYRPTIVGYRCRYNGDTRKIAVTRRVLLNSRTGEVASTTFRYIHGFVSFLFPTQPLALHGRSVQATGKIYGAHAKRAVARLEPKGARELCNAFWWRDILFSIWNKIVFLYFFLVHLNTTIVIFKPWLMMAWRKVALLPNINHHMHC